MSQQSSRRTWGSLRRAWAAALSVTVFSSTWGCSVESTGAPGLGAPNGNDSVERPPSEALTCPSGSELGTSVSSPTVSYRDDILPILGRAGCLTTGCHGGSLVSVGYDVETYDGIFGPGATAEQLLMCNVVPGRPDLSFLMDKISNDMPAAGERMPLERDPLTEAQISLFRTWILEGATDR